MESLSNMISMPPNYQQQQQEHQVFNAFNQFFADLESLSSIATVKEREQFTSNVYMDGQAYSILSPKGLVFYLMKENEVSYLTHSNIAQVVSVEFTGVIDLTSARHICLEEISTKDIGIQGYFSLAFGKNNFALILIQKSQGTLKASVQWIKEYELIQGPQAGASEFVTSVNIVQQGIYKTRQGFQEHAVVVLLGVSSLQKVVQLRFSLLQELKLDDVPSIMTNREEVCIYEEQKTLKSRISNFLSSRLGYRGEAEQDGTKAVKETHIIDGFVVIITGKDILIVRQSDQVKVFEADYLDSIKEYSYRQDQSDHMNIMKELVSLSLVASSVSFNASNRQLCVNLFVLKQQNLQNPQSYQTLRHNQIIYAPNYFDYSAGYGGQYIETSAPNSNQFITFDLESGVDYSSEFIKAVALNYSYFSESLQSYDTHQLLLFEFLRGKSIAMEVSMNYGVKNPTQLSNERVNGFAYKVDIGPDKRDQTICITLITEKDVDLYSFDPNKQQFFSNTQPYSLKADIESKLEEVQSQQAQQQTTPLRERSQVFLKEGQACSPYPKSQDVSLFQHQQPLRPFICHLLDQVGSYVCPAQVTKSRDQAYLDQQREHLKSKIYTDVQRACSVHSEQRIVEETLFLLLESIDVMVESYSLGQDEVRQAFNDEGLIEVSLENKEKQVRVIEEFLLENKLYNPEQDHRVRDILSRTKFNLNTAKLIKSWQDIIKQQSYESQAKSEFRGPQYSLEMVFFARAMKAQASMLLQSGQTHLNSQNVVYSKISEFHELIQTLIRLAVDPNIQQQVKLSGAEDSSKILASTSHLLNSLLDAYLKNPEFYVLEESFLMQNKGFFDLLTSLADRVKGTTVQNDQAKASLIKLANNAIQASQKVLPQRETTEMRDNMIYILEEGVSKEEALLFAKIYQSQENVCRLIFELGSNQYDVLHECIELWGDEFLGFAFDQILKLETESLRKRSPQYKGFQMFAIFEDKYLQQFSEFLQVRNAKLFSMLCLRNNKPVIAHEILKHEVNHNIQGVKTMQVFSSLGSANVHVSLDHQSVEEKQQEQSFFEAHLDAASLQAEVFPQNGLLQKIDKAYLQSAFINLEQRRPDETIENLKRVLDVVNLQGLRREVSEEDLKELKLTAWRLVISKDYTAHQRLKQAREGHYINDQNIKSLIQNTLTFKLGQQYDQSPSKLDQELQQILLKETESIELQTIFHHLNSSIGFGDRASLAFSVRTGPDQSLNQSVS